MSAKKGPGGTALTAVHQGISRKYTRKHSPSPTSESPQATRRIYLLRLKSSQGDGIHALRWTLKRLLRQYGLRCLEIIEEARL
jgi:hypothetical protein